MSWTCGSGPLATYLSLSATKITRRSKRREAKILMIWRTLRHLKRHSKSTCSRRESMGRRSSMTWTHPTNISQHHWSGLTAPGAPGTPAQALQLCSMLSCWGDAENDHHPLLQTEAGGTALQRNGVLHNSLSSHSSSQNTVMRIKSPVISEGSIILPSKRPVRNLKLGWGNSMKHVTNWKHWSRKLTGLKQP